MQPPRDHRVYRAGLGSAASWALYLFTSLALNQTFILSHLLRSYRPRSCSPEHSTSMPELSSPRHLSWSYLFECLVTNLAWRNPVCGW